MSAIAVVEVAHLRLRARQAVGGASTPAETFLRAMMAEVATRLDRHAPGQVWRIRTLPVRWRLAEHEFMQTHPAQISACAEEVVRFLLATAPSAETTPFAEPPANAEVAVFASESLRRAACLAARAGGRRGRWFFADLEADGGAEHLLDIDHPAHCRTILTALRDGGCLLPLIATWPSNLCERLAAIWDLAGSDASGARDALDASSPTESATPPGSALAPPAATSDAAAPEAILARLRRQVPGWERLTTAQLRLLILVAGEALALPTRGSAGFRWLWEKLATGTDPVTVIVRSPRATPPAEEDSHCDDTGPKNLLAPRLDLSAQAGLVYCLAPWLELGAGELLWRACLDETACLAYALALLGGDQAIITALGGVPDVSTPPPEVGAEQRAEVVTHLLDALRAAIPHRSRLALPAMHLEPVMHQGERLLLATCGDLPFALAAWPLPDQPALNAILSHLATAWPAPLAVDPSLAALARQLPTAMTGERTLLPDLPRDAACVVAVLAGAAATLIALRSGLAGPDLAACWAVPGRIADANDVRTIHLPMERIELPLRRAGLDRDPGWVPWLRATVRIVFTGAEDA